MAQSMGKAVGLRIRLGLELCWRWLDLRLGWLDHFGNAREVVSVCGKDSVWGWDGVESGMGLDLGCA